MLKACGQNELDDDPDIASKALKEQFDKLLLQPLLGLKLDRQYQTAVMVINDLDECEYDQDVRNIMRLLPLLQKARAIRLRIFLTSRPELPICLGFSDVAGHECQHLALHEIPEEVTENNILLFLQKRFATIKHDGNISEDWPGDDVIRDFLFHCLFRLPTLCPCIENSKWEPQMRLAELLNGQAKYLSRMDKTYLPNLERLIDEQDKDYNTLVTAGHSISNKIKVYLPR